MSSSQVISVDSADALLFDLGGVVIEINFDLALSYWAACSNRSLQAIKSRFSFDDFYERHERGEIGASEYFDSLRATLEIDISDSQFVQGWNAIYVREVPGIAVLLRRAKGRLPLYALSNSNPAHQQVWSHRFSKVLSLFQSVFVSWEMGARKPEPEAFHAVAKTIGIDLPRIVFFDDSIENIDGARALGLTAVHVKAIEDVEDSLKELLA